MKTIGIITIHKINNYGSVLQAYALQKVCELLGYTTEIIDYNFPNNYQKLNNNSVLKKVSFKDKLIKIIYAFSLYRQHRSISNFVKTYQHLSAEIYDSPKALQTNPPQYDIYMTGSDQLWNPNYCCGDPSFFLDFLPEKAIRISYASSFGISLLEPNFKRTYSVYLSKYKFIGVRENSAKLLVDNLLSTNTSKVVLDPTLLLDNIQWDKIATPKRIIPEKYILCYFLNYSFNAFPYVDQFARHIQSLTGYKLVKVARPPRCFYEKNTVHLVGASPENFLALIRDAEVVITTSFHGTAFAVNFDRPLFSIISKKSSSDSRQMSLLQNLGLGSRIISLGDPFPDLNSLFYNSLQASKKLKQLRIESVHFLSDALNQSNEI